MERYFNVLIVNANGQGTSTQLIARDINVPLTYVKEQAARRWNDYDRNIKRGRTPIETPLVTAFIFDTQTKMLVQFDVDDDEVYNRRVVAVEGARVTEQGGL